MKKIKTTLVSLWITICCLFCCVACNNPVEVSGTYHFYEIVVNAQSYKVGNTLSGQTLQPSRMELMLKEDKTFHLSEKKFANKPANETRGEWSVKGNEITLSVNGMDILMGTLNGDMLTIETGQKTVLKRVR